MARNVNKTQFWMQCATCWQIYVLDQNFVSSPYSREDPVAVAAAKDGVKVFKYKSWRRKGVVLPEVLEEYKSVNANVNVMPFCSQFIPME